MRRKGTNMSDATKGAMNTVTGRWLRKAGAKLGTFANLFAAFAVITPEAGELGGKLSEMGRTCYEIADKLDPVAPGV